MKQLMNMKKLKRKNKLKKNNQNLNNGLMQKNLQKVYNNKNNKKKE